MQHETKGTFKAEDDSAFALMYAAEHGTRGRVLLKKGRKPVEQYKDQRRAQERRDAEAAAETILRHRIADNERRYPEIFAVVRSPDFNEWYLTVTGVSWERRFEGDIEEMRFRIFSAAVVEQKKLEISVKKD